MKTYIIPYRIVDDLPTFEDFELTEMFNKMVRDNTLELVFFDGTVKTPEAFINFMNHPAIQLYAVYIEDSDNQVGFIWLERFTKRTVFGHFCVFSEHWGNAFEIGNEVLTILLTTKDEKGNYFLDAVYGFVPEDNELALLATTNAGFKVAGILPNAFYYESDCKTRNGVMLYCTRNSLLKGGDTH